MNTAVTIASIASATAVAAPSSVPERNHDPMFALIDAHKKARADFSEAVRIDFALEEELPKERARTRFYNREFEVVETDDPRWIEAEQRMRATSDHLEDVAVQILNTSPTSLAGVTAILAYVAEAVNGNDEYCWPLDVVDEETERAPIRNRHSDVPWETFLCRHLSRALLKMQAH